MASFSSAATPPPSPSVLYRERLAACQAEGVRLERRHVLLSYVRLVWVLLGLGLLWLALGRHLFSWAWVLAAVAGFGVTARLHARVLAARQCSGRAERFYQHGLARLEDRWAGVRPRTTRVDYRGSLFADDLDLFSPGGVFELLCTARTSFGEDTLAAWLLAPASAEEVRARQPAVAELRDRLALREDLARARGPEVIAFAGDSLPAWGEAGGAAALPASLLWLAPVLVLLTLAAGVRWGMGHSALPFFAMLVINRSTAFALRHRLRPLFAATERAAARLGALAAVLARLEQEPVTAARLQALRSRLAGAGGEGASVATRRLRVLAAAVEQRNNPFVVGLDLVLLASVQLGWMVHRWRTSHGAHLRDWLAALGEYEAVLALASYHFEHPDDCFPEVVEGAPQFAAEALGHPLLPAAACVRNEVRLDGKTQLLLISGSNMSGKSTLLRAVGAATVIALAGGTVRARALRLSPLHVAASIQVHDSLQGGQSRFYAEILRLRAVCERARLQPPVLFLLDELLAGTNSHDRLVGAAGVVRELLAAGALGLLSTHDLSLTQLAAEPGAPVRNAHFEDRVEGDRLAFDYTLREGVVTRSNGLALMRLIGLDV